MHSFVNYVVTVEGTVESDEDSDEDSDKDSDMERLSNALRDVL
jgi:hypothetical protein